MMPTYGEDLLPFCCNLQANGAQIFWDTLYKVLAIENNVSDKAAFANFSSKLLVNFSKVDLSLKLLEKVFGFLSLTI